MNDKENITGDNSEAYGLMLELERLESLREDLLENGVSQRAELEALLATNPSEEDRQALLSEIQLEMLELNLSSLDELNRRIDSLNDQLDQMED